ncbi:DUF883 family protein [Brackiella oedipodis]|uniref:DUF883 family protein n=1 Tax=Brackiella oedipodis TaxID=124225 RepID=UPI00048DF6D3|nr:DUF883 family protein [Brackiella oedipodis]
MSKKDFNRDLNKAIEDAEILLKRIGDEGGDEADNLRDQARNILSKALNSVSDASDAAVEQGKEVAKTADNYVQENPWSTAGIAAVAGILLGVVIARR